MVLHEIEKIMSNIPEVENVVAFYDEGTVFQTTFDKLKVNIPKLGTDLSAIISLFKNLQTKNEFKMYKKIVFDGLNVTLIIFKVGEQSNFAVFFKKELTNQEIQTIDEKIMVYINRIKELIDIDRKKLLEKELEKKRNDFQAIERQIAEKKKNIDDIELSSIEKEKKKKRDELDRELVVLLQEKKKLEDDIQKLEKKNQ